MNNPKFWNMLAITIGFIIGWFMRRQHDKFLIKTICNELTHMKTLLRNLLREVEND